VDDIIAQLSLFASQPYFISSFLFLSFDLINHFLLLPMIMILNRFLFTPLKRGADDIIARH